MTEKKSTHKTEVVRIGALEKHPNADSLEITKVFDFTVIVKSGTYKTGDLAAYVVADSIVPFSEPEFAFLANPDKPDRTTHRITGKRLRKIWSEGLLIPARPHWKLGDDVSDELHITRHEPGIKEEDSIPGEPAKKSLLSRLIKLLVPRSSPPSKSAIPYYDVDSYRRYSDLFSPDDIVIVTEKVHGANIRIASTNGKIYVGSRRLWKFNQQLPKWLNWLTNFKFLRNINPIFRTASTDPWVNALKAYPRITAMLTAYPNMVLYGEIYGPSIQADINYNVPKGEVHFVGFDLYDLETKRWVDKLKMLDLLEFYGIPHVPVVYLGNFNPVECLESLEENSVIYKGTHREGLVITSIPSEDKERVQLKVISARYLEAKG